VSDARNVFVGMGLTWSWARDEYAGTVVKVSIDQRVIFFKQDRPLGRGKGLGPAYLFVEGRGLQEYEARLEGNQYVMVLNGRPVELGVRRWRTIPAGSQSETVRE
jgi:hypothetical protein